MTTTTRSRLLAGLGLLLIAAAVVSLTFGRDLYEGARPDLTSFALVHFAGYLFFIVMPVELLVPWYLIEGHVGSHVAGLAVGTALAAQLIDYGIGRLLSDKVVHHLIGERRLARAQGRIERFGPLTILLFNLFPLSSPTVVAVAGVLRFGLLRTMLWSAAGLSAKYLALTTLFAP